MKKQVTDNQRSEKVEIIVKVANLKTVMLSSCPIRDILSSVIDKWTIHTILLLAQHQKLRFTQIKTGIKGISQRMLTVTLRSLEKNGAVIRTHYPEVPIRVEYELTSLGKSLYNQLSELTRWAEANHTEILKARRFYNKTHYPALTVNPIL